MRSFLVIVRLLLDGDADVHAGDDHWETPLYKACYFGRHAITTLLLDRGADIHYIRTT